MYIIAGDRLGTGTEAWLVLAFPLGAFEGVVTLIFTEKRFVRRIVWKSKIIVETSKWN